MYKTRSKFMGRHEAGFVYKAPHVRNEGPEFRLTVCLACTRVMNTPSIRKSCSCGGRLGKVDGQEFFGRVKLQLLNQFRRRMGILKKQKHRKILYRESKVKPHELALILLPKEHWSPGKFPSGCPSKIWVKLHHIPSGKCITKTIEGRDYHGNGSVKNFDVRNQAIAEELCSELEIALGMRERESDYLLDRYRVQGAITLTAK